LLLAPCASASADQKRGPSTPEERQQALDYIQHFQADPLSPNVASEREWVIMWSIEVPDIHVNVCMLADLPKGDKKHGTTLFAGMMMAQIAYAIQHKGDPPDNNAEYLAGMQGMLNAYEKVIATNPKDHQPALDDLLQRRQAGTLADYVKDRAASSCSKK